MKVTTTAIHLLTYSAAKLEPKTSSILPFKGLKTLASFLKVSPYILIFRPMFLVKLTNFTLCDDTLPCFYLEIQCILCSTEIGAMFRYFIVQLKKKVTPTGHP